MATLSFSSLPPLAYKLASEIEANNLVQFTAKELARLLNMEKYDVLVGIFQLLERKWVAVIHDSIPTGNWQWEYRRTHEQLGNLTVT